MMDKIQDTLVQLAPLLPTDLQEQARELAASRLVASAPLQLVVLGGFSVGKSSLLNMLMGEALLHTAPEEATALPTFIEHGATLSMALVGPDGSTLPLDLDGFRQATSQAPDGTVCATLALPLEWLRDVTVVDLPGLGSVSAARQEYTAAQVQQADAVLYLLEPRGPTRQDMEALRIVRQYGKRVKVVVTRWDMVVNSVAQGEKAPDLGRWSEQIKAETGLCVDLQCVSVHGLGREQLLQFVAQSRQELSTIRLQRFRSEMRPLLENAMGSNVQAQHAYQLRSEDAVRRAHAEVLEKKQQLYVMKTELYARQKEETTQLERDADDAATRRRQALQRQLQQLLQVQADSGVVVDWEHFGLQGGEQLREALAALAVDFSSRSVAYGALQLPDAQVSSFNLRLPVPVAVDVSTFLETGKLLQLQQALSEKQQLVLATENQLQALPSVDLAADELQLHTLAQQRRYVIEEPLARVIERTEGNGGAQLGRFFGEIADLALICVNPATVGAKVGALVGQGVKIHNVVVKAQQISKIVTETTKVAQAIRTGDPHPNIPQPILQKLGALEVLSLAYWGERIGNACGGAPSERSVVDPQALAEQRRAVAELDAGLQLARNELVRKERLASERELTGWALEQSNKEALRLQQEISELTVLLDARAEQARQEAHVQHQRTVLLALERAVGDWLRSYEQQAAGMQQLLMGKVDAYWAQHVESALAASLEQLQVQLAHLDAAPQERALALTQLQREAQGIETAIAALA